MTAGTNGTVTLRIFGINPEQDREGRHPFILTGVPIRLERHDRGAKGAGATQETPSSSGPDGTITFTVSPGRYHVLAGPDDVHVETIEVTSGCELDHEIRLSLPVSISVSRTAQQDDWEPVAGDEPIMHTGHLRLRIEWLDSEQHFFRREDEGKLRASVLGFGIEVEAISQAATRRAMRATAPAGRQTSEHRLLMPQSGTDCGFTLFFGTGASRLTDDSLPTHFVDYQRVPNPIEGSISVGLRRTASRLTEDVPLWIGIRKSTDALSFDRYYEFMNWVFCGEPSDHASGYAGINKQMAVFDQRRRLPFTDTDAYRNIKVATEAFVMANCGIVSHIDRFDAEYVVDQVVVPASPRRLRAEAKRYLEPVDGIIGPGIIPYLAMIRRKLADQRVKSFDIGDVMQGLKSEDVDACYGLLRRKLTCPCLFELIWSYWQEEGMLVQTMNALARRFQNVRSPHSNDPLANLEIDALRPLNSIVWGYIQDEQHRLSVVRRNYEYDHQYGLRLAGRAVQDPRTADSRSKFLEAFHTLLSITANFYKRDDDTTIVADGFPVLNGLKEAHLILSQSAQNQYGEMPSTARIEMLMQQWILSRPEFREFLPTRIMVAYPEPWMDRVDAMKKLQGWTDTSVLHFRNLAVFGEQILLSIRFGAWAAVNDPVQATNWARYWRPEVQGYLHAYRSVTGVDLSVDVTNARIDATLPSVHLVHRLEEQFRRV
jgi:hypothetical protein